MAKLLEQQKNSEKYIFWCFSLNLIAHILNIIFFKSIPSLLLPSWLSTHLLHAPLDSDDMRSQSLWQPAGLVTIKTFLSLIPAPFICIEITFWDEWVVPSSLNLCLSELFEHLICVPACLYQCEHLPCDENDKADSVEEPDLSSLSSGPHFNIAFGHVFFITLIFYQTILPTSG